MPDTTETTETTPAPPQTPPVAAPAVPAPPPADPLLGPNGEKALAAERDAREAAEKESRQLRKERDDLKRSQESEQERLQREATEGQSLSAAGTAKLREANTLLSLADKGLTGASAQAALKLLDGVEYGDDDKPSNLDVRLDAAKAVYGETYFGGATPPTSTEPTSTAPTTTAPNHQGPRRDDAQLTEDEKFAAYMGENFGEMTSSDPVTASAVA